VSKNPRSRNGGKKPARVNQVEEATDSASLILAEKEGFELAVAVDSTQVIQNPASLEPHETHDPHFIVRLSYAAAFLAHN
jgi:hypothetical protein